MDTFNIEWKGCHGDNFKTSVGTRPIKAIVLHLMDGTLVGTDAWFNDPKSKVSAHYGVGRNGEIHRYVQDNDVAFHAGQVVQPSWSLISHFKPNPNEMTLGIEHEGVADEFDRDFPDAQVSASAALVAALCAKYSIPLEPTYVIGHHEIKATKPCPGNLPRALILQKAAAYGKVL